MVVFLIWSFSFFLDAQNKKKSSSNGAVVGVVIAVLLLLVLFSTMMFLFISRKRTEKPDYGLKNVSRELSPFGLCFLMCLRCNAAFAILYCAEAAFPESIVRLYAVVTVTDLVIRPRGR